jgi:hypothetical protein
MNTKKELVFYEFHKAKDSLNLIWKLLDEINDVEQFDHCTNSSLANEFDLTEDCLKRIDKIIYQ